MDIDKIFKDKIFEGQAPVEDSLWSNIEAKLNTPSANPSTSNTSPAQATGVKSSISQVWNAMSVGAKVVTSLVSVALISTAVVLIVNNANNTSSNDSNPTPNNQEQLSSIVTDTTNIATTNNLEKSDEETKKDAPIDIRFEPDDDDEVIYNINDIYKPNPPSKIENNTTPSEKVNPKKNNNNNNTPNKVEPISHVDTSSKIDVMIPNYITPNADGINDCFNIKNIDRYPDNTLIVKDRKGKVVFRQSHYSGSFCGENCVVGTYFYELSVRKGSNVKVFTGVIEIIR